MITDIQAIVLAAGKAKRFRSGKTKLTEKLCGQEIIIYPISVLNALKIPITLVVGFQSDKIKTAIETHYPNQVTYVEQHKPTGTAHATKLTQSLWNSSHLLIVKGDAPLITPEIIENLYKKHIETNAAITFISAHNNDPTGFSYSKVIKTDNGTVIRTPQELAPETLQEHCCINGGIYVCTKTFLQTYIDQVQRKEQTNEFHLSELINIAGRENQKVSELCVPFDYVRGISTFQELWAAEQIKRAELIKYWMDQGVRFSAAQTVHMDLDVEIGAGSFIGCSAHISKGSVIGNNCVISPFAIIENSRLGDNVRIEPYAILRNTQIGNQTTIGPFAHLQEKTIVGNNCHIGNFVETKRSSFGDYTKAKHLSYIGDAQIGSHVNIGAGTITCNYDGKEKHTTKIEDYAFIGTNNSIVAPVTIHQKSFTAAGSVITKDVPEQALAIARSKQINKEGYAAKLKAEETSCNSSTQKTNQSLSFVGAVKSHSNPENL